MHTELAKCEEDLEQIQVAMEHLKKVGCGSVRCPGRRIRKEGHGHRTLEKGRSWLCKCIMLPGRQIRKEGHGHRTLEKVGHGSVMLPGR